MLEEVAKIIVNKAAFDYFDFKNIMSVNKTICEIVSLETHAVDKSFYNRLYANIVGYFMNVFPNKLIREDATMGVRILFKGTKQYTNIEDKFVIGIGQRYGEEARYYFGNQDTYECVSHTEISQNRDIILRLFKDNIDEVCQIDIIYCNIEEQSYFAFISQFLQIITQNEPARSINLTRVNFIPENILIFS